MARDSPSTSTAFNKLPIELNKFIAHYLPTDKDIVDFLCICRATNYAIDGDKFSFWRARFREKYALRSGLTNKELKRKYQRRAKHLRHGMGMKWGLGNTKTEQTILRTLIELITESFQGTIDFDECGYPRCPNQMQLANFVLNSRILLNGKRPEFGRAAKGLAAVKLMCAHFLFNPKGVKNDVYALEESQKAVYAPTVQYPIYEGQFKNDINMDWVLHCLNFFRHYMTNPESSALFHNMQELESSQQPSAWREPLKNGTYPLCKYWKGTYAYLLESELERFRMLSNGEESRRESFDHEILADKNVEEGNIQSLQFDFVKEGNLIWPDLFEDHLQSKRPTLPTRTRAQHSKKSQADPEAETSKNIMITGIGEDGEDEFYATGWLNPLPEQADIPGWQRITFMKHFEGDLDMAVHDHLWAYEGVVLPGGRLILGRWWFASDRLDLNQGNEYGGPFILWAVDSEEPLLDEEDEA